jgi:hypothetical protein
MHVTAALTSEGAEGRIARKGIDSSERLGRHRWVVERTLAWLNRFRRLTIRYERRADIDEAFLHLGCILVCWNFIYLKGGLLGALNTIGKVWGFLGAGMVCSDLQSLCRVTL